MTLQSPFPLLHKSVGQTSCFQEGSALPSLQTRVRRSQPPISLPAYYLQHHLLHFTLLLITWYFCKQHVPGSSCTLPLRELLHKHCDCLNKRTILSSDVNFSFSLAEQCKLWQFGGTAWVTNGGNYFPRSVHVSDQTCTPSFSIPSPPVNTPCERFTRDACPRAPWRCWTLMGASHLIHPKGNQPDAATISIS